MVIHQTLFSCLICTIWIVSVSADNFENNALIKDLENDYRDGQGTFDIPKIGTILRLIGEKSDSSATNEQLKQVLKRQIDKYRYFGGLGKRLDDEFLFNESFPKYKRKIDQYRFFGGLGKRFETDSDYNIKPLQMKKRFDRMKYFGAIGKRSALKNPSHPYLSYYGLK